MYTKRITTSALLFLIALGAACDSSSSSTCGVAGGTQACACSDGAAGAQTCAAAGSWEPCICAPVSDTVGGDTTTPTDTTPTDTRVDTTVSPVPGCIDQDANNFDSRATVDDGSCTYDVSFAVRVSVNPEDVVYVSGDFQTALGESAWCAGCNPMTLTSPGEHRTTVSLPPGTYQYKFQVNEWASSETVPDECRVVNGEFVNRGFVVTDGPVAIPLHKYSACPCYPETCTGRNACIDLDCGHALQGLYTPGRFVIETARGTCQNKMGVIVDRVGNLRFFGVDPTTGEPTLGFSEVSCQSGFSGSSLPMRVEVKSNGAGTATGLNEFSAPYKLIFKHADFTDEITGTISATITNGTFVGAFSGLPQTVSIGLDNQVTRATFTSPE